MSWWLGKNVGVPQGTWKGMGKKLGIGLSDDEKVARSTKRRIQGGQATPQEQLEILSGRMSGEGVQGEYDVVNPRAARVANRYASGQRAKGAMDKHGEARPAFVGPRQEGDFGSGKPLQEWTSDEVKEMQRNMNAAGFVDSNGEQLKVDGMIGPKTVSAMRNAQASRQQGGQGPVAGGGFSGPRGDYSDARQGLGAGGEAISEGARTPVYGKGTDDYIPGGAATEEDFAPSIWESIKNADYPWK